MRRGVLDHIIMQLLVFVFFVTMLFLVIDYSNIARVQNVTDTIAQQGARMISLEKSLGQVANMINSQKTDYYTSVSGSDIVCITTGSSSQISFTANADYNTSFPLLGNNGVITVISRSSAYNEANSSDVNCTISLIQG